jgi:6-phosphogluconolactonase (cycloisomerase 2 family)
LTKLSEETNADNPNYLAIHEGNRCIYTVSDALCRKEGVVTAYQLNPATGRLSYIDNQGTLGSVPAYTSFECAGKFLLGANYSMGCQPRAGAGETVTPRPRGQRALCVGLLLATT